MKLPEIPPDAYFRKEIFDDEIKKIFEKSWLFVGHINQLSSVGDHLVFQAGNESVLIVRNAEDDLKAFINICPHRGLPLVGQSSSCKKNITCPYHAWIFDLNGRLSGIPAKKHYLPDLDLNQFKLHAVRINTWRGLIFINLDNTTEELNIYLKDFPEYINGYEEQIEELNLVTVVSMEEPINWKIVVENYVEDYHFSFVHPQTLIVFDHKRTETLPTGDHLRIFMPYREAKPSGDTKYPWVNEGGSQQGFIWPSMTIQPAINHLSIFQIVPIAPERTRIDIPVFQTKNQAEKWPLDLVKFKSDVLFDMEEDFAICRELQKATHSRHFKIGALSNPHELGVSYFANIWQKYMNGEKNA